MKQNPSVNNFWQFIRQHGKGTHKISAAYDQDHNVIFEPKTVREQVVKTWQGVFKGKTTPIYSAPQTNTSHDSIPNSQEILDGLAYYPPTTHEKYICRPFNRRTLRRAIDRLKIGKACGVDNVPAEAIKFGSKLLQEFLLHFYNTIFATGYVPVKMNIGKCLLLHKV